LATPQAKNPVFKFEILKASQTKYILIIS
jgi:hypothetical protein